MGQLNAAIVPVTAFQQNCTILFDAETKVGVVVDPGGDVPRIQAALEQYGIQVGCGLPTAISTMPAARWS